MPPISFAAVVPIPPPPAPQFSLSTTLIASGAYANRTTNSNGYAVSPLFTDPANMVQYWTGFDNATHKLSTSKRNLPNGAWQAPQLSTTPLVDYADDHCYGVGAVDGNGRAHIFWGMHVKPMTSWHAVVAGDYLVDSVDAVPIKSGQAAIEAKVTYPYPMRLSNGNVWMPWRYGTSGAGTLLTYELDFASNWDAAPALNIFEGEGVRNFYPNNPVISPAANPHPGRRWFSGCWRQASGGTIEDNENEYCAYTDDGLTYFAADGTAMALPMTFSNMNAAKARTIPRNSGLLNNHAMTVDDQDRPLICGFWRIPEATLPPDNATSRYRLIFWDGSSWVTQEVTAVNNGSRPMMVWKDGYVFVIHGGYPSTEGIGIWVHYARKSTGYSDWVVVRLVSEDLKDWSPCFDHAAWTYLQKLYIYKQRCVFTGSSPSASAECLELTITVG